MNKEVTLAELKLQIERMEVELQQTKKRNSNFERFIKKKGLVFSNEDHEPEKVEVLVEQVVDKKNNEEFSEEIKSLNLQLETALTQITQLSNENDVKVKELISNFRKPRYAILRNKLKIFLRNMLNLTII